MSPHHARRLTCLIRYVGGVAIGAIALGACAPAATAPEPTGGVALRAFDGCEALTWELRRRGLAELSAYGVGVTWPPGQIMATDPTAAGDAAGESLTAVAAGSAFSATNVQVAGADEPDVVKTDGAYLYSVTDGVVRVIDVRATTPRVAATVGLDAGSPRELLLHDGRLLVLGDDIAASGPPGDPDASQPDLLPSPAMANRTRLWSVDVRDPASPVVTSTMAVDGALVATRLIDGTARLVVRSTPVFPGVGAPGVGARDTARALVVNREQVRSARAEQVMPTVTVDGGPATPLVACTAVQATERGSGTGLVSVLTLDVAAPRFDVDRVDAVLGAAETVYADEDSLYVTTRRWPVALPLEPGPPVPVPEPLPPEPLPPGPPVPVPPVPPEPLPPGPPVPVPEPLPPEPLPPGPPVPVPPVPLPRPPQPSPLATTEVHRFDLQAAGARHVASGSVPGTVLNQWAMSEHDDVLRIATTVEASASVPSRSAVHLLRVRGRRLVTVGRVDDLGHGERIYAVRYAGDVGFVVTFRQVDPLYTLDLSDPTAPRVLGELKVPGYSAYLHPIGADHLLGVGQDADLDGQVKGLQVSLFDLRDLRSPRRVGTVGFGGASSSAVEYDHRALLAWPDRDLVAVPVQRWDTGATEVAVLTADDTGRLGLRGTIALPTPTHQPVTSLRTLVVGDRLITVGPTAVVVSDLDPVRTLARIRL